MPVTEYDILVPVEMVSELGFTGHSGRQASTNQEKAFSLMRWHATFHDTSAGDRYIIVQTHLPEDDARKTVDKIISALPFVSVSLDASIRAKSRTITVCGGGVDINSVCIFPSGIGHHPYGMSGKLKTMVSIDALAHAFSEGMNLPESVRKAAEVFSDVDFEASTTSRLVLITTALELLCLRGSRDDEALTLIDAWKVCAKKAKRADLVQALELMRQESISSAIRMKIQEACKNAFIKDDDAKRISKRTVELYRKRSSVVHGGACSATIWMRSATIRMRK